MKALRFSALALAVLTAAMLLGCSGSEAPIDFIKVTPKAAAAIRQVVADRKTDGNVYLRVRVVPGGCTGFMQKLDLDPDTSPQDQISDTGVGVQVVVFRRQIEMVRGSTVDYGDKDGQTGFMIDNPNLKGADAAKWLAVLEKETDRW